MPSDLTRCVHFTNLHRIQAGGTLFKVPQFGPPMERVLSCIRDSTGDDIGDGKCDEHPIVLPSEVTAYDFQSFLKAAHPLYVADNSLFLLTIDEFFYSQCVVRSSRAARVARMAFRH